MNLTYSWFMLCTLQEGKRGQSVLHEAVCRQDTDIVNAILGSKSTNVNLETYDCLTALDMAISIHWDEGQRVLELAGGRTANGVRLDGCDEELITDMDWSVALICFA